MPAEPKADVEVVMLRDRYAPGMGKVAKDSKVKVTPGLAKQWTTRRIAVYASEAAEEKASVKKTFTEVKKDVEAMRAELEEKTVKELRKDADKAGLDMPKRAKKDELVSALLELEE